jgi:LL-diaminopimelate aminotransferase
MDLQNLFAQRIGGNAFGKTNAIYKFEKIKRAKAAARAAHPEREMLDFGVGEPDLIAPRPIRAALKKAVDKPENRGYADNGIPAFKHAAVRYMESFFGVAGLDPDRHVNHTIGSKSALAMLPLCFVDPGDQALVTVPGYPVLATHVRYLGGTVIPVPLTARNRFLPDLAALEKLDLSRVKLFYVNYPNNPTGAAATPEFFDALVDFAIRHGILIVQDAAYATLAYNRPRLSILSRPRALECAIELHSMSKSYNMTGWRLGFAAGNPDAVKALATVKDNMDSGQFKAIQEAACAGIADLRLSETIRRHYQRRLRALVKILKTAGFKARMPGGTFYLYVPAPSGTAGGRTFATAEDAAQYLITEHSISTVPWDDAGRFLRFSATFESAGPADDARVLSELAARLASARLVF